MIIEKKGESKSKLEESLNKLNKLLLKYGFEPGKVLEVSEVFETPNGHTVIENPLNLKDLKFLYYKFKIEVPTMSFGIEGTEFIASMEIGSKEAGNRIFMGFNPEDEKAGEYNDLLFDLAQSRKSDCDHCHTNRVRNRLFIFKKDGQLFTIGSTCAREWYGIEIERFLKAWKFVNSFSDEDEDRERGDNRYRRMRTVSEYLAISIASILRRGFVASKYDNSTANDICEVMAFMYPGLLGRPKNRPETHKFFMDNYQKISDMMEQMQEWYQNLVPSDLFLQSLRSGVIDFSLTANQAPWAIVKWMGAKNIEYRVEDGSNRSQEVRPEILQSPDKHVAAAGTKIKDIEGQISFTYSMDSDFGVTHLIKIATLEGDIVWYTGKNDFENCSYSDLVIGTKVKISGSVKACDQYKGKAQTIVTRCKLSLED